MSDEPDRQELEDRIDELESTISKMLPGRRDALKLGGAALVGGAAMSGSASAGTQQAGTIGTANNPVDVESEDINNADTVTTQDLVVNHGLVAGELIGSDSSSGQIQVTGIDYDQLRQIVVVVESGVQAQTDLTLTVDNDTNNLYNYFDADGTATDNDTKIRLADQNNTAFFAGSIIITPYKPRDTLAFEINLAVAFEQNRNNSLAIRGGYGGSPTTGSLELSSDPGRSMSMEVFAVR